MAAQQRDAHWEQVAARLEALEREVASLRQENESLRDPARAQRDAADSTAVAVPSAQHTGRTSRRDMLKALGVTVGAGAATMALKKGELYVDNTGALFCCVANGTPGTWKQVQFA